MTSPHTLLSSVSVLALLVAANGAFGGAALAADLGGPEPLFTSSSTAQTLPAVSGVNAKVGAFGSSLGDESAGGAFIGLALPLGHRFGAQIDGIVGMQEGGDAFQGVAGHLFWRDPSRALFGIYASHLRWDGVSLGGITGGAEVNKVGLETQLYLGRVSLEGLAGYQFGSDTGLVAKGTIAYYPRDDLRLHVGVTHYEGPGLAGFAGLEWAPLRGSGLSLFADVGVDENSDLRSLAGVKFYFSREDKSLIRRHREDDPDVDLPGDLFQAKQGRPCPAGQVLFNGFCDGNT